MGDQSHRDGRPSVLEKGSAPNVKASDDAVSQTSEEGNSIVPEKKKGKRSQTAKTPAVPVQASKDSVGAMATEENDGKSEGKGYYKKFKLMSDDHSFQVVESKRACFRILVEKQWWWLPSDEETQADFAKKIWEAFMDIWNSKKLKANPETPPPDPPISPHDKNWNTMISKWPSESLGLLARHAKTNILQLYDLVDMDADERTERVISLLEDDQFAKGPMDDKDSTDNMNPDHVYGAHSAIFGLAKIYFFNKDRMKDSRLLCTLTPFPTQAMAMLIAAIHISLLEYVVVDKKANYKFDQVSVMKPYALALVELEQVKSDNAAAWDWILAKYKETAGGDTRAQQLEEYIELFRDKGKTSKRNKSVGQGVA